MEKAFRHDDINFPTNCKLLPLSLIIFAHKYQVLLGISLELRLVYFGWAPNSRNIVASNFYLLIRSSAESFRFSRRVVNDSPASRPLTDHVSQYHAYCFVGVNSCFIHGDVFLSLGESKTINGLSFSWRFTLVGKFVLRRKILPMKRNEE